MKLTDYLFNKQIFTLSAILILFISCDYVDPDNDTSELKNIHIGLYIDNGAVGIDEVENMLEKLGCFYSTINKDTILTSNLS